MIVADTNIIVYLLLDTDFSKLSARAYKKDPEWVAPGLWKSEFINVLALYLHKGHITVDAAQTILRAALTSISSEFEVSPEKILELAASSKCSAYDCEFVALAQQLQIPLVTMDKQILEQFPRVAINLDGFMTQ